MECETEGCKKDMTNKVEDYSKEKFGKAYCYSCQQTKTTEEAIGESNTENEESKPISKIPKDVPEEYIVLIQGKEYITHQGLLHVAHGKGLERVTSELVETKIDDIGNISMAIFKATVFMSGGKSFSGYGDATLQNVNSMIKQHLLRMAETRSISRALRLATNIGLCSSEELGGKDVDTKS